MFLKIVYLIFAMGLAGSLARFVSIVMRRTAQFEELPEPEFSKRWQKSMMWSFLTGMLSITGLVLLLSGQPPLLVLIAMVLCVGVIIPTQVHWKFKPITRPRGLAYDAVSGALLGEVLNETRNWRSGALESFTVRTRTGQLIERTADTVSIGIEQPERNLKQIAGDR